jgi:hypothetical protein
LRERRGVFFYTYCMYYFLQLLIAIQF